MGFEGHYEAGNLVQKSFEGKVEIDDIIVRHHISELLKLFIHSIVEGILEVGNIKLEDDLICLYVDEVLLTKDCLV